MVELLENCTSFSDFGIKGEIYIPNTIFDSFNETVNSLFIFMKMKGYEIKYHNLTKEIHSFKFLFNGEKAFTIQITSSTDKYHNIFHVSLFYHFHNDYSQHILYKNKVNEIYVGYNKDDNLVHFSDEYEIINGLKKLQFIV